MPESGKCTDSGIFIVLYDQAGISASGQREDISGQYAGFVLEKIIDTEEVLHYNRSKKNDKGGGDVFLG